jgi:hypothetical protein
MTSRLGVGVTLHLRVLFTFGHEALERGALPASYPLQRFRKLRQQQVQTRRKECLEPDR